ncbi:molybdenum cofactor biosynthesis protein 1-like protein [Phycomyces blakesleeanus]
MFNHYSQAPICIINYTLKHRNSICMCSLLLPTDDKAHNPETCLYRHLVTMTNILRSGIQKSPWKFLASCSKTNRNLHGLIQNAQEYLKPISSPLVDTFNRKHNYLRISLTEKCNLRCTYCMPAEGVPLTPKENLLTTDEILKLARLFVSQGTTKIRLTGGEPTVRPDLLEIIQGLGELKSQGLESIGMTSNGIALKRKLPALKKAGLDTLNISLDTLDRDMFGIMTRRQGFDKVLGAIDEAVRINVERVKINCVVIRGTNDDQVLHFAGYTKDHPVNVRFIEYMPFDGNRWKSEKMVPYRELLTRIESIYGKLTKLTDDKNDTTKAYQVPGYQGKLGFISSMTDHFCDTCNRLRITADGSIKVCLFGNSEVSLRDLLRQDQSDEKIVQVIGNAVRRKKRKHAAIALSVVPSFLLSPLQRRHYSSQNRLTHTDPKTGEARMVAVEGKKDSQREARAVGRIVLPSEAFKLLKKNEIHTLKGNVLVVAQIAGIQASKQTSQLIPLCHPLALTFINVNLWLDDEKSSVECESTVRTVGKTGVEMEALMATSTALLTVYDMCKAASKYMVIQDIHVVSKEGGKSGSWQWENK